MWTNNVVKQKQKLPNNDDITCTNTSCIYKKQIEFAPQIVKYKGKNIPLKDGGYINLKTGIHYYNNKKGRLWNRL